MNKENKHNKDLGFQVPQDFFKNFEESMLTQLILDEKLGKETGFQVPDDYFESLEKQLLPVRESKVVSLNDRFDYKNVLYPILAIAAVLAIIMTMNTGNSGPLDFASLETSELEEYLVDEASLYDESTIEILFADNDMLDNMSFSDGIDDDDLYDYLQEEIELNEIITE